MFLLALQVTNRYSYLPMVKTFLPSVAYRNIGHVCLEQGTKYNLNFAFIYTEGETIVKFGDAMTIDMQHPCSALLTLHAAL